MATQSVPERGIELVASLLLAVLAASVLVSVTGFVLVRGTDVFRALGLTRAAASGLAVVLAVLVDGLGLRVCWRVLVNRD